MVLKLDGLCAGVDAAALAKPREAREVEAAVTGRRAAETSIGVLRRRVR